MSKKITLKHNLQVGVRWATVDDAATIARIELSSSHYEHRKEPFTLTHPQFTKLWKDRLKSDLFKTILVYEAKAICGFLTFKEAIEDGKILALYVDPIFMRHGVGKLLLSTAIEMVELKGGIQMEVEFELLNNAAITFYESLLFHKVSVKLEHLFVMKKEL